MTGSIPPELSALTNLTYFQMNENELTVTIPAELGNLTELYTLDLHTNSLGGSIPPELGNLSNMGIIYKTILPARERTRVLLF